jgi:hypothetical protein
MTRPEHIGLGYDSYIELVYLVGNQRFPLPMRVEWSPGFGQLRIHFPLRASQPTFGE